jgi:hypothetical protein
MSTHAKLDAKTDRFHLLCLDRARKPWGHAWDLLTADHREALLAREALHLLLSQCDSMPQYDAGKALVRRAMAYDA